MTHYTQQHVDELLILMFRHGVLSSADMSNANLPGVYLNGTDLHHIDLREANLSEAEVRGAKYEGQTHWPDGFDPRAAGPSRLTSERAGAKSRWITSIKSSMRQPGQWCLPISM